MTNNEIKKLILNNVSYDELLNDYKIPKYDILKMYYFLINRENIPWDIEFYIRQEYLKHISFLNIKDENILLVSDQHLGSKEESIFYQELAEDFRKQNNINIVLNGGDIGDGMLDYDKKYGTVQRQVDHILDVIPRLGGEKYILGGNHDNHYLKKGIDILQLLEEDSSIHGVGYYQSYFKIYDKLISFNHNSKMQEDKLLDKDFTISGHSHLFVGEKKKVKLPTLSDNNPNDINFITSPGFVLLRTNKVKNQIILDFSRYIVNDNKYYLAQQKTYKM